MAKKKKKKKLSSKKKSLLHVSNQRKFFKRIGIKPLVKPNEGRELYHINEEIIKRIGSEVAESYRATFEGTSFEGPNEFCHKSLDLAKIYYGGDFNLICKIAQELKQISIPNISNVLDLGGSTGQIAFFMAKLWKDCNITVADKYSDIGLEWANEIGEDRVRFKDAQLPNLSSLSPEQFDLVVMSRVLGNMEELGLPSNAMAFDTETYFNSRDGKRLFSELGKIAVAIRELMTDSGHLLVIDSWSEFRELIIGRAFERKGLFIDVEHFNPQNVGMDYSTIVFTNSKPVSEIHDLPHGLAVAKNFKDEYHGNVSDGIAAESMRKLFNGATVIRNEKFIHNEKKGITQCEILEKEGFSLMYFTHEEGNRVAIMGSALSIPYRIENLRQLMNSNASKRETPDT